MSSTTTVEHPVARLSGPSRLDRPARRIISLLPSATEIVCALGLSERLVAVTHECDYPPEQLVGLPRVTSDRLAGGSRNSPEIDLAVRAALADGHGLYALDEALMTDLEPDLILTQELCRVCAVSYPTVLEAARAGGGGDGPLVVSLEPHSLRDVFETITLVARLTGVEASGQTIVDALSARLSSVRPAELRPRVAVVEWLDPLFAPGHWVPEQVEAAGGEPAIGFRGEPSRELAWDALAATDPQVVVLGLCGFDLARTIEEWKSFEPPDGLRQTTPWRDGQLWAIDGSAHVSRPGPRLVDGVEILADILAGRPNPRALRLSPD